MIAKNRKARLQRTEEILKLREENFNIDPSEENITKLDEARSEYETLYDYIIQGKIIRSRANWYEQGERNLKYFLNLETSKTKRTSVRRLINADEKLVLNSRSIMKELEDFYTSLYKNSESTDCDRRFQDFLNGHTVFRGLDRTGLDWTGKTRTSKTRTSKTRTSKTRTCKTRTSKTRTSKTRTSKTRTCKNEMKKCYLN